MSRYRYLSTYLGTPFTKIAELRMSGVEWQRLRNGAGVFRGTVKLPPPTDEQSRVICALWRQATDRGSTCIYVIRDGVPMAAYAVWGQDYSSENQTISVSGSELPSVWQRRIIHALSGDLEPRVSFEGVPMYTCVVNLLGRINDIGLEIDATPGGPPLPVTVPATNFDPEVPGTGWRGTDAKKTGDAIDELANMDDGFDYRVDLRLVGGEFQRVFVLRPSFGENVTLTAKFGATAPKFSVRRRGDVRSNDAIAIGPANGEKRPYGRATGGSFRPTLQTIVQVNDESDPDRLDAAALAALKASQADQIFEVDVVADDVDAELGTFFPGDYVRFIVPPNRDPWFYDGFDKTIATIGYSVRVPDTEGRETITLQLPEEAAGA